MNENVKKLIIALTENNEFNDEELKNVAGGFFRISLPKMPDRRNIIKIMAILSL